MRRGEVRVRTCGRGDDAAARALEGDADATRRREMHNRGYRPMWWMLPETFGGETHGSAVVASTGAASTGARARWSARAFARWLEGRGARVPTFVRELGGVTMERDG